MASRTPNPDLVIDSRHFPSTPPYRTMEFDSESPTPLTRPSSPTMEDGIHFTPKRAMASFDNLIALANHQERLREARKMVWRDRGEPAAELNTLRECLEHAALGGLREWFMANVDSAERADFHRVRNARRQHSSVCKSGPCPSPGTQGSSVSLFSFPSLRSHQSPVQRHPIFSSAACRFRDRYMALGSSAR